MGAKFNYTKLDPRTRELMRQEIVAAQDSGNLYYSTRFNEIGKSNWPQWLLTAAASHDEHWLAYQIEANSAMKDFETKEKPKGGYSVAHVPHTASETLADGQFTRFYMAAVCRRTLEDGKSDIRIYRAKQRGDSRSESQALEGTTRDAKKLLQDLKSKDLSLKCDLLKPNSGLSVDY